MRDKIADMIREWNPQECYIGCYEKTPCKICIEAITKADAFLALEVEGWKTCDYPEICEAHNMANKTNHCDDCRDYRPATIGDLINTDKMEG